MYASIFGILIVVIVTLVPNSIAQTSEMMDNSDIIVSELEKIRIALEGVTNYNSYYNSLYILIPSVIVAGGTIVAIRVSINQNNDAKYMNILRGSLNDLYDLHYDEKKLQTKNDCENYATRFLDIMSVVAHLYLKKKIPNDILEFLKYDFDIARSLMNWFDYHNLGKKYDTTASKIWLNLQVYYDKNRIYNELNLEILPDALQNFEHLETKVFVYDNLTDNLTRSMIIHRQVLAINDVLEGYSQRMIKIDGKIYTNVVQDYELSVYGKRFNLTPSEIGLLDKYKGDQYTRVSIKLRSNEKAWIYIISDNH